VAVGHEVVVVTILNPESCARNLLHISEPITKSDEQVIWSPENGHHEVYYLDLVEDI
jgi:hypothetical protein